MKLSFMKAWIKYGIILALSGILVQVFMFVTDTMDYTWTAFGIMLVLSSLVLYFGMAETRDQGMNGSIKYGKALIIGLLISLIAGSATSIYSVTTYDFIGKKVVDEQMDQAEDRMADWGLDDEQIDEALERQKSWMGRWPMAGMAIVTNVISGLMLSLIIAAIVKREPKEVFEDDDPKIDYDL